VGEKVPSPLCDRLFPQQEQEKIEGREKRSVSLSFFVNNPVKKGRGKIGKTRDSYVEDET